MQNSYYKIKENYSIFIITICLPLIVWQVGKILPTFDDFTTLQSPQFTSPWSILLLPNESFWRPWDYLFGCLLGQFTGLFPILNHVAIITGHTISSFLVFLICKKIGINYHAVNIATLFFFFSPASLGATLACDGLNQTYAQLWGLLGLWLYLKYQTKICFILWPCCTMMAALSKENGLAWAIVPPIFVYAFQLINRRQALKHVGIGILIAALYFVLRITLRVSGEINSEYLDNSLISYLKDIIQLLAYTWLPIDYMSIVYAPTRNWPLAVFTFIISMPFLWMLFFRKPRQLVSNTLLFLIICFLIVISPHVITLVSIMHNYAGLAIASIIIAYLVNQLSCDKRLVAYVTLYLTAAIITDIHHTIAAQKSGFLGKQMALEAIQKTVHPIKNAYCITIDDEVTPKYSSFGVRPVDAFAWGLSVRYYTNYAWPDNIRDTVLFENKTEIVKAITDSVFSCGSQCVWIADNQGIKVINK